MVDVCNDGLTVPSEVASVERDVSSVVLNTPVSVDIDGVVYDCELSVDGDVCSVPEFVVRSVDSTDEMKEMLSVVLDAVDGSFVRSLEKVMCADDPSDVETTKVDAESMATMETEESIIVSEAAVDNIDEDAVAILVVPVILLCVTLVSVPPLFDCPSVDVTSTKLDDVISVDVDDILT